LGKAARTLQQQSKQGETFLHKLYRAHYIGLRGLPRLLAPNFQPGRMIHSVTASSHRNRPQI